MSADVIHMLDWIERHEGDLLELPSGERISQAEARELLRLALDWQSPRLDRDRELADAMRRAAEEGVEWDV